MFYSVYKFFYQPNRECSSYSSYRFSYSIARCKWTANTISFVFNAIVYTSHSIFFYPILWMRYTIRSWKMRIRLRFGICATVNQFCINKTTFTGRFACFPLLEVILHYRKGSISFSNRTPNCRCELKLECGRKHTRTHIAFVWFYFPNDSIVVLRD